MFGKITKAEIKGDTFTITGQLDKEGKESSTGKSIVHMTTSSWQELTPADRNLRFNLTIIGNKPK